MKKETDTKNTKNEWLGANNETRLKQEQQNKKRKTIVTVKLKLGTTEQVPKQMLNVLTDNDKK